MCDACPECPECGRDDPEPANIRYMSGLLAPSLFVLALLVVSLEYSLMPSGAAYMLIGYFSCSAVMLVSTDQHVERWWRNRVQE